MWGRGIGLRGMSYFMGMSISKFDTTLFGEGKFNLLAIGCSNFGNTHLDCNLRIHNSWYFDGSFLGDISTLNNRQTDWFVHTDLFRFRVCNGNININRVYNGDIVSSFLGNFFAIVVSITTITMSMMAMSSLRA